MNIKLGVVVLALGVVVLRTTAWQKETLNHCGSVKVSVLDRLTMIRTLTLALFTFIWELCSIFTFDFFL